MFKSISLKADLKWVLMAIALICLGHVSYSNEAEIPELINRRNGGDTFLIYNSSGGLQLCRDGNNLTYLVDSERRCERNEIFLNSKCNQMIIIII